MTARLLNLVDRLATAVVNLSVRRVESCPGNPGPHYHPNALGRWIMRTPEYREVERDREYPNHGESEWR